jgi:hypothetical protein
MFTLLVNCTLYILSLETRIDLVCPWLWLIVLPPSHRIVSNHVTSGNQVSIKIYSKLYISAAFHLALFMQHSLD